MKISYAITVCNEFTEIQRLVAFLLKHKRAEDSIVILYDAGNGDPKIEEYLRANSINGEFIWHKDTFNRHFADWKNKLTSLCTGDFIFQIDADEYPNEALINMLPEILEVNKHVDMFMVPRVNTVAGLTDAHVAKWRWHVNESGYVNWPDYQTRIYKNNNIVKWKNKVHEVLEGFGEFTFFPQDEDFALFHPKNIVKQEKQNSLYNTL